MAGAPAPVEVQLMLTLSTAHLREATCNQWLRDHCVAACEKTDVGWFVYVCDDPGQGVRPPNELTAVMDYARSVGCNWIMFDCDGPVQPGLVEFDW